MNTNFKNEEKRDIDNLNMMDPTINVMKINAHLSMNQEEYIYWLSNPMPALYNIFIW